MKLNEDQLAGILQTCVNFARDIIVKTGGFGPFGGRVRLDGELEFFAFEISKEALTLEDLYYRTEAVLIEEARQEKIFAASIAVDVIVPDAIETGFRNAIGVFIETPDFCRFAYATYRTSPDPSQPGRFRFEQGEMFSVEGKPTIFPR